VVDAQLHYTTSRRLAGSVLTSGLCRSCSLPSYESTFVHSRAYFAYNASYLRTKVQCRAYRQNRGFMKPLLNVYVYTYSCTACVSYTSTRVVQYYSCTPRVHVQLYRSTAAHQLSCVVHCVKYVYLYVYDMNMYLRRCT
jgi:hypothetical protein